MAEVAWFADAWERGSIVYYLTLARGISPLQLAERVADGPVERLPDMTPLEAEARIEIDRRTILMLADHFDLHLPQDIIEEAPLPAVLLRTTPPSTW